MDIFQMEQAQIRIRPHGQPSLAGQAIPVGGLAGYLTDSLGQRQNLPLSHVGLQQAGHTAVYAGM